MNRHPLIYHESYGVAELPYNENVVTPLPMIRKRITNTQTIESQFQSTFVGDCTIDPNGDLIIKADADWVMR